MISKSYPPPCLGLAVAGGGCTELARCRKQLGKICCVYFLKIPAIITVQCYHDQQKRNLARGCEVSKHGTDYIQYNTQNDHYLDKHADSATHFLDLLLWLLKHCDSGFNTFWCNYTTKTPIPHITPREWVIMETTEWTSDVKTRSKCRGRGQDHKAEAMSSKPRTRSRLANVDISE